MISVHSLPAYLNAYPELFKQERFLESSQCHFSQNGEDIAVNVYLQFVRPRPQKGLVIDFGAYHPYHFSNTFLLYLQGWRGANVDGNEEAIEKFIKLRPDEINLHALLSDKEEELDFYKFPEGGYNTAVKESADFLVTRGATDPATRSVKVSRLTATTANKIFERYAGSRVIDFLSIDLEGLDERVLTSIDFNRFRPRVMCVELPLSAIQSDPLKGFLERIGYSVFSVCVHSTILTDVRDT